MVRRSPRPGERRRVPGGSIDPYARPDTRPAKEHPVPHRPTTDAHQRTRDDHAAETAEDYVEAIADAIDARGECRVRDLAQRFGVSHVTVLRIVRRLEREGYAETTPYQPITLTAKGDTLAKDCRERHDTVYRFLRAIGVGERAAAIDSEGIEHHLSPETLARFRAIADSETPAQPASTPQSAPQSKPKSNRR